MTASDALAIAPLAVAAGVLAFAIKCAAIGSRPVVPSIVDWWRGRHTERKLPQGGWRCDYCHATGADLGSLPPMGTTYDRASGSVERSSRW